MVEKNKKKKLCGYSSIQSYAEIDTVGSRWQWVQPVAKMVTIKSAYRDVPCSLYELHSISLLIGTGTSIGWRQKNLWAVELDAESWQETREWAPREEFRADITTPLSLSAVQIKSTLGLISVPGQTDGCCFTGRQRDGGGGGIEDWRGGRKAIQADKFTIMLWVWFSC